MRQRRCFFLLLAIVFLAAPVFAQDGMLPEECETKVLGEDENIQKILICHPTTEWNGDWVVYTHGYVAPQEELALPIEELTVGGVFLPLLIVNEGYAFATTSYSEKAKGFDIEQAGIDINALVDDLPNHSPDPNREIDQIFMVGASEGGLVTTMLVEQFPTIYAGGLSLCGPVAGSLYQIQYVGDFRVVFDYYFPLIFDFGAVDVPAETYSDWEGYYTPRIALTMLLRPFATKNLFSVTQAAFDPAHPVATAIETALTLLFYNVSGTQDLIETAGGIAYDNQYRWYGTRRNWLLNLLVERVKADVGAQEYLENHYVPTGDLMIPLVTVHNTLDPAVPFEHENIYAQRVADQNRSDLLMRYEAPGYGHCNFSTDLILTAFNSLILKAGNP